MLCYAFVRGLCGKEHLKKQIASEHCCPIDQGERGAVAQPAQLVEGATRRVYCKRPEYSYLSSACERN